MVAEMPMAGMPAPTVVIVDDSESTLRFLEGLLHGNVAECSVRTFTDPCGGLEWCLANDVGLIVLDYVMPRLDGLAFIEAYRRDPARADVPIVMVTSSDLKDTRYMALQLGATDFLGKPIDEVEFITRVRNLLALSRHHQALAHRADWLADEVGKATDTLVTALTRTIAVLSRAIEMRDPYTDGHQKRVSALAVATATAMGLPSDRVTGVRLGSLVHDVGKIAIPAELLSCPRQLTEPEMAMIRCHPVVGRDILAEGDFPWPLARMVAEHHERMDGSGYPRGLAGEAICLEARIIAVADVVEAMSSHRPYRPARGMEAAMAEIRAHRGSFYDADVVDNCIAVLAAGPAFWDG